jgi:hypothetical protein
VQCSKAVTKLHCYRAALLLNTVIQADGQNVLAQCTLCVNVCLRASVNDLSRKGRIQQRCLCVCVCMFYIQTQTQTHTQTQYRHRPTPHSVKVSFPSPPLHPSVHPCLPRCPSPSLFLSLSTSLSVAASLSICTFSVFCGGMERVSSKHSSPSCLERRIPVCVCVCLSSNKTWRFVLN